MISGRKWVSYLIPPVCSGQSLEFGKYSWTEWSQKIEEVMCKKRRRQNQKCLASFLFPSLKGTVAAHTHTHTHTHTHRPGSVNKGIMVGRVSLRGRGSEEQTPSGGISLRLTGGKRRRKFERKGRGRRRARLIRSIILQLKWPMLCSRVSLVIIRPSSAKLFRKVY